FAAIVNQRAARVAGIDGSVGLDEIFVVLDAESAALSSADDTGCHSLADAERIADRQNLIADLHLGRVADRDIGKMIRLDLKHRDVALRISADDACLEFAAVAERHLNIVSAVDHVIVSQNIAFRTGDHARSQAVLALLWLAWSPIAAAALPPGALVTELIAEET